MTEPAVADHAAPDTSSRRALLGVGVIGVAVALAGARSASPASAAGLSAADTELAAFAIGLELTARDLYDAAVAAGSSGDAWTIMREQHEAYATRLAGLSGVSANSRNDDVHAALVDAFSTADPVTAARDLENTAAATHIALLEQVESILLAEVVAAIASMESRHSTVLGLLDGAEGDDLFTNPATPVEA